MTPSEYESLPFELQALVAREALGSGKFLRQIVAPMVDKYGDLALSGQPVLVDAEDILTLMNIVTLLGSTPERILSGALNSRSTPGAGNA